MSGLPNPGADAAWTVSTPEVRPLLEGVAVQLRRSAAIFRANRMRSEAARADRFAARIGLRLTEPKATRRMHTLADALYEFSHPGALLERALEGAISLIGGDFGNIQLRDLRNGTLRIAAQAGFGSEFLEYFAVVDDDASACGRAASQRSQSVIVDVNQDPTFTPHRKIAAASRFRAVQSTPVIDPTGRLRGVISTHFRRPHLPASQELELMQWYAEHVGAALAQQQVRPTTLYEATAALHAHTADLQHVAAARLNGSAAALRHANGDKAPATARQEWARHALERAQRERRRAEVLAARVQNHR